MGEVLDEACEAIAQAQFDGIRPTRMSVAFEVYRVVADAKSRELSRGNPLMLLGLTVIGDETLRSHEVRIG